jgi:hypothetical protein
MSLRVDIDDSYKTSEKWCMSVIRASMVIKMWKKSKKGTLDHIYEAT